MEKLIITFALVLAACSWASGQKTDSTQSKRTQAAQKLLTDLDNIYQLSIHLSNHIESQKSDQPISPIIDGHINTDMKSMALLIKSMAQDVQMANNVFTPEEKPVIGEQLENIHLKDSLMNVNLRDLVQNKKAIPEAQMAINRTAIANFITAIRYFKEYLQLFIPVVPMVFSRKIDTIISLVKPTTDGKQYLAVSAYNHNVYGLSYMHRIGGISNAKTISYLGVEVIGPIKSSTIQTSESFQSTVVIRRPPNDTIATSTTTYTSTRTTSTYADNPGGFLIYGLRYSRLLMTVGVGYFKTNVSQEDVSWKCGALYTPKNLGIGISYSPLTSVGVHVAYKW